MNLVTGLSLGLNLACAAAALVFVKRKGGWQYLRSKLVAKGVVRDRALESFENAYYLNKRELFAIYPASTDDVVFLGDSLTDHCQWSELFADGRLKNRGISGDTVAGVRERIAPLFATPPHAIFLLIGINDLNNGKAPEALRDEYRELLQALLKGAPRTRILLQTLLPVDTFRWGQAVNERVLSFNQLLSRLATELDLPLIDLHPLFASEGRLDPRTTHDGLHLNAAGYQRWKEALTPFLSDGSLAR